VSSFEGKVLAVNLIIVSGGIANYVFGASSDEEKNRMPTYIAQWKGILQAKSLGCTAYNFGAVTSDNDAHKGWEGLTIFKKKFGGYEVAHADFYDVVTQPVWYHVYNFRKLIKRYIGK
jgi:lipid II:glycine glycyltransferase (peptidoglycan interpeptide bridge formation enzyme)